MTAKVRRDAIDVIEAGRDRHSDPDRLAQGGSTYAWDAAEQLWQKCAAIYPEDPDDRGWRQVLAAFRRRHAFELLLTIVLLGLGLGSWLAAMIMLRSPISAAAFGLTGLGLIVAAVAFIRDPGAHRLARLTKAVAPAREDLSLSDVMDAFRAGRLTVYENDEPSAQSVSPSTFADRNAMLLLHPSMPVRSSAARWSGTVDPNRFVVRTADLAHYTSTIKPLRSYLDLIAAPAWLLERARRASLEVPNPPPPLIALFRFIDFERSPSPTSELVKKRPERLTEFRDGDSGVISRPTYHRYRTGHHPGSTYVRLKSSNS